MKKAIFSIIMLGVLMLFSVSVYGGDESDRWWYFGNSEFSEVMKQYVLNSDVTINGLTISNNMEINASKHKIRNMWANGSIYTTANSSINSGYIKFHVNGNTDIHILAKSKGADARNITVYSDNTKKSANVLISSDDDYKYEYRGGAGNLYLYTAGNGVRIYGIGAKDYNANEYAPMNEGEKKEWDFGNYTMYGSIKENTNIDGLSVFANVTESVVCSAHYVKDPYGDAKTGYIDFGGTGKYDGRYITFKVPQNSDIYISAKSSANEVRTMLVSNRYHGSMDTNLPQKKFDSEDVETSYVNVGYDYATYKISYYGKGDEIALYSLDSGIRIYKITVVPRVSKIVEEKQWNISNNSNFAVGKYTESTVIDGLELEKAEVQSCNIEGYTKRIGIKSKIYNDAGKVKFKISDSSGERGEYSKRVISLKAATEDEKAILVVMNSEGYVLGINNLSKEIKEYKYEYTGTSDEIVVYTYYPQNTTRAYTYIYSINNGVLGKIGPNDMEKTIDVAKGQSYKYYLTCNNIEKVSLFKYTIYYNADAIEIKKIGENPVNGDYRLYYDSAVTNISNVNGVLSFEVNRSDENWSGILLPIEFVGKSTGKTTIKVTADIK